MAEPYLFTQAFCHTDKSDNPFWLRGAIAAWSNQYLTVNTVPVHAKAIQIGTQYKPERQLLEVLTLEKSWFRQMRLLIERNLLANYGAEYTRTWDGFLLPFRIVTRLRECNYPPEEQYADVLWIADDEKRFDQLKGIMATRFKRSTFDPDKFAQAAWTRAMFDQVDTLAWICRHYADQAAEPNRRGLTPNGADAR